MTKKAANTINSWLGLLDEQEAVTLVHKIFSQFGWSGTFFTQADAEEEWNAWNSDDDHWEFGEDEWEAVKNTWFWRVGITDQMIDAGVQQTISEAVMAAKKNLTRKEQ